MKPQVRHSETGKDFSVFPAQELEAAQRTAHRPTAPRGTRRVPTGPPSCGTRLAPRLGGRIGRKPIAEPDAQRDLTGLTEVSTPRESPGRPSWRQRLGSAGPGARGIQHLDHFSAAGRDPKREHHPVCRSTALPPGALLPSQCGGGRAMHTQGRSSLVTPNLRLFLSLQSPKGEEELENITLTVLSELRI